MWIFIYSIELDIPGIYNAARDYPHSAADGLSKLQFPGQ